MTDDDKGKERNKKLIDDNKHMKELLKTYKFVGDPMDKIKMYGNIVEKTNRYLADVEIRRLFDNISELSRLINTTEDLSEVFKPDSKSDYYVPDNINAIIKAINARYTQYKNDINKFNTEYTDIKSLISQLMELIGKKCLEKTPITVISWQLAEITKEQIDILAKFIIFLLSTTNIHNIKMKDTKNSLLDIMGTYYSIIIDDAVPVLASVPALASASASASALASALASAPAPVPASDIALETQMSEDYKVIQRQDRGSSCGRNAINNYLRKIYYTYSGEDNVNIDLPIVTIPDPPINLQNLSRELHKKYINFASEQGENYDISTLIFALQLAGVRVSEINTTPLNYLTNRLALISNGKGLLINIGDIIIVKDKQHFRGRHWVSVRKENNKYYYYDSLRAEGIEYENDKTFYFFIDKHIGIDKILRIYELELIGTPQIPSDLTRR
jgi:hypothetical protein